jgi:hypothetical protein
MFNIWMLPGLATDAEGPEVWRWLRDLGKIKRVEEGIVNRGIMDRGIMIVGSLVWEHLFFMIS